MYYNNCIEYSSIKEYIIIFHNYQFSCINEDDIKTEVIDIKDYIFLNINFLLLYDILLK